MRSCVCNSHRAHRSTNLVYCIASRGLRKLCPHHLHITVQDVLQFAAARHFSAKHFRSQAHTVARHLTKRLTNGLVRPQQEGKTHEALIAYCCSLKLRSMRMTVTSEMTPLSGKCTYLMRR